MYSISTVLLTAIAALLTGIVVGIVYARKFTAASQQQREVERHLERLQQQQKDYQHEVAEHFTDTAKLLSNLAESYRDVHNHLAGGAEILCQDKLPASVITRLPDSSDEYGANDEAYENVSQPLDYAPKSSPYETGMLNEEFGIDKNMEQPSNTDIEAPIQK